MLSGYVNQVKSCHRDTATFRKDNIRTILCQWYHGDLTKQDSQPNKPIQVDGGEANDSGSFILIIYSSFVRMNTNKQLCYIHLSLLHISTNNQTFIIQHCTQSVAVILHHSPTTSMLETTSIPHSRSELLYDVVSLYTVDVLTEWRRLPRLFLATYPVHNGLVVLP